MNKVKIPGCCEVSVGCAQLRGGAGGGRVGRLYALHRALGRPYRPLVPGYAGQFWFLGMQVGHHVITGILEWRSVWILGMQIRLHLLTSVSACRSVWSLGKAVSLSWLVSWQRVKSFGLVWYLCKQVSILVLTGVLASRSVLMSWLVYRHSSQSSCLDWYLGKQVSLLVMTSIPACKSVFLPWLVSWQYSCLNFSKCRSVFLSW